MFAATAFTIGWLMFSPVAAPVPADPPPDPLGLGYLGAYFLSEGTGNPLAIDRADPNTPAQKAGLLKGDVIVRFGSLEPKTFNELKTHIMSYRPGAVVEVEIDRNGERKAIKVTLTSRPPDAGRSAYPVPDFPPDK